MGTVNIRATVSALIPAKTPSPSRVNAPPSIRSPKGINLFGGDLANSLAGDLEGLAQTVNALHSAAKVPPTISQILLTNQQGEVIAGLGPVTYQGVSFSNWLSEIHIGNPLLTLDPNQAIFNANLDGSVTIGENGWLEVLDPFGQDAAWIGTQNETLDVTGAVNNGSGLIRLTVASHTLITGNSARVQFVGGVSNATGIWTVTKINANTVDLQGSIWSGLYTSGGVIDRVLQISGATNNGAGLIRIKTSVVHGYESGTSVNIPDPGPGGVPASVGQWVISVPATLPVTGAVNNGAGLVRLTVVGHNFTTGDRPQILNVGGVPNADGYFVLTVVDASHVDLQGSVFAGLYTAGGTITFLNANFFDLTTSAFAGAYTTGGTCLEYFAGMLAQTVAIGPSFTGYKLRAFPSGDLRIRNASIELSSASGKILLDPITSQIILTSTSSLAEILLDATVPSLTLFDQTGTATVTMEILTETALAITVATNAAPTVLTVPGNTYVNGDTILIQGATGNTIINGYRIVEDIGTAGAGTFHITPLQGPPNINGTGVYAGAATATRYYAGLLAQTLALGGSFAGYRLRFFADGTLKINNASIDASTITNSTLQGSFTSTAGTAPNLLTLSITNGILTISGTGTQAGNGTITIDGIMTAGEAGFVAKAAAPTAPGAGFAFLYYDNVIGALRFNLAGAGWVNIGGAGAAGGANTQVQFNNTGVLAGAAGLTWSGTVLAATGLSATTGGLAVVGGTVTDTLSVTPGGATVVGGLTMDVLAYSIAGTTGAQVVTFGANAPAAIVGLTPATWLKVTLSNATVAYFPVYQ